MTMSRDVLLLDRLPAYIRDAIDAPGDHRETCPKCGGGRTGERSLSIRSIDDGVVKLSCWRATCGWWGLTVTEPDAKIHSKQVKPANVYRDPIEPLSAEMLDILVSDYGLSPQHIGKHGWGRTLDGALIMPVRNAFGQEIGHTTRTLGAVKRCMTYKATSMPFADWWMWRLGRRPTVIVEDQLSACRAHQLGYDAVCLLGTNMSIGLAKDVAQYATDPTQVFLALDRDAFHKAIKLANRHAHIVRMRVVCLDKDIKNCETDKEIHDLFGVRDDRRDSTTSGCIQQQGGI